MGGAFYEDRAWIAGVIFHRGRGLFPKPEVGVVGNVGVAVFMEGVAAPRTGSGRGLYAECNLS